MKFNKNLKAASRKQNIFWEARTRILAWYLALTTGFLAVSIPVITRLILFQVNLRVHYDLIEELKAFDNFQQTQFPQIETQNEAILAKNPIRRQAEGTAIALSQDLGKKLNFTVGYVSNEANEPDRGLLRNPYAAITQLTFLPSDRLNLSLTYNYTSSNVGTGTGSELAENPFQDSEDVTSHGLGGEFSFLLQPNISLGGRVGWIQASAQDLPNTPQADILTWAMMLGVSDLGSEDSLLGFVFGQPPKVIENNLGAESEDPDTAYHLEAFYRWQLTDDIAVTPGLFTIFNPEHNSQNDSIVVGTIRTTLEF